MKIFALQTLAEQDLPLHEELWQYFYNTYFTDNNVYENLQLGTGSLISVKNIIIGICIGMVLAAFASVFNKRTLGGFVRTLLREECLGAERAKTLSELGYLGKYAVMNSLRSGYTLRKVVKCREEEEFYEKQRAEMAEYEEKRKADPSLPKFKAAEYRVDPRKDSFYIPEEMKYMADVKFDEKGTTLRAAISFIVVMMVALIVMIVALPYILEILNDLVGVLKGSFEGAQGKLF